jgi:hypothetical protein
VCWKENLKNRTQRTYKMILAKVMRRMSFESLIKNRQIANGDEDASAGARDKDNKLYCVD